MGTLRKVLQPARSDIAYLRNCPEDIGAAEFLCGRLAAQMSFCILQMQNFSLIKSDQSRAIRKRLVEAWSLEKPDNIELELLAKVAA